MSVEFQIKRKFTGWRSTLDDQLGRLTPQSFLGAGRQAVLLLILPLCLIGCGVNILSSTESSDPAEDALLELEANNSDRAVELLEAALEQNPGDPTYLSILSTALAQRAGIDLFRFVSDLASGGLKAAQNFNGDGSGLSSDNGATTASITSVTAAAQGGFNVLFDALPPATTINICLLNKSVAILTQGPDGSH